MALHQLETGDIMFEELAEEYTALEEVRARSRLESSGEVERIGEEILSGGRA